MFDLKVLRQEDFVEFPFPIQKEKILLERVGSATYNCILDLRTNQFSFAQLSGLLTRLSHFVINGRFQSCTKLRFYILTKADKPKSAIH